ncbi:hypothetical protein HD553DRAFT_327362 [Filobasidium floriforme]|uniref:uncharacterized protein n=1 Tax=Filobasidium floriforme TaxID=5210 RepID=UPI001E8EB79F|nr:uncharacterized protein HD553DRAFT_327362 [Filobasidium floriforme]KAH8077230.1 hypothetical protein HD553DRAFT_327362 [Filobasidium floriforme]
MNRTTWRGPFEDATSGRHYVEWVDPNGHIMGRDYDNLPNVDLSALTGTSLQEPSYPDGRSAIKTTYAESVPFSTNAMTGTYNPLSSGQASFSQGFTAYAPAGTAPIDYDEHSQARQGSIAFMLSTEAAARTTSYEQQHNLWTSGFNDPLTQPELGPGPYGSSSHLSDFATISHVQPMGREDLALPNQTVPLQGPRTVRLLGCITQLPEKTTDNQIQEIKAFLAKLDTHKSTPKFIAAQQIGRSPEDQLEFLTGLQKAVETGGLVAFGNGKHFHVSTCGGSNCSRVMIFKTQSGGRCHYCQEKLRKGKTKRSPPGNLSHSQFSLASNGDQTSYHMQTLPCTSDDQHDPVDLSNKDNIMLDRYTEQRASAASGKVANLLGEKVTLPDISDAQVDQFNHFLWRLVGVSQIRVREELEADKTPDQHLNFLVGLQQAVGAKAAYGNWYLNPGKNYWVVKCSYGVCDRIAIRDNSAEEFCDNHNEAAMKRRKRRFNKMDRH